MQTGCSSSSITAGTLSVGVHALASSFLLPGPAPATAAAVHLMPALSMCSECTSCLSSRRAYTCTLTRHICRLQSQLHRYSTPPTPMPLIRLEPHRCCLSLQTFQGRYYRYNEVVGRGRFKQIFKAFDTQIGIDVAWSKICAEPHHLSEEQLDDIVAEMAKGLDLEHPNIIKCFKCWVGGCCWVRCSCCDGWVRNAGGLSLRSTGCSRWVFCPHCIGRVWASTWLEAFCPSSVHSATCSV